MATNLPDGANRSQEVLRTQQQGDPAEKSQRGCDTFALLVCQEMPWTPASAAERSACRVGAADRASIEGDVYDRMVR